mgnify:CR=1 FL=1
MDNFFFDEPNPVKYEKTTNIGINKWMNVYIMTACNMVVGSKI